MQKEFALPEAYTPPRRNSQIRGTEAPTHTRQRLSLGDGSNPCRSQPSDQRLPVLLKPSACKKFVVCFAKRNKYLPETISLKGNCLGTAADAVHFRMRDSVNRNIVNNRDARIYRYCGSMQTTTWGEPVASSDSRCTIIYITFCSPQAVLVVWGIKAASRYIVWVSASTGILRPFGLILCAGGFYFLNNPCRI